MNHVFERVLLIHTLLTPSLLFLETYIQLTEIIKISVGTLPLTKTSQSTSLMVLKS